jgi:hypothetical protein
MVTRYKVTIPTLLPNKLDEYLWSQLQAGDLGITFGTMTKLILSLVYYGEI